MQERDDGRIGAATHRLRKIALGLGRRISFHFPLQLHLRLLLALIGEEEKKFVAAVHDMRNHDGPAEGPTVLVTLKDRPSVGPAGY